MSDGKNAKRREAKRLKKEKEEREQRKSQKNLDDDNPVVPSAVPVIKDPLDVLKDELTDAKAAGDMGRIKEIRQDIWILQDMQSGVNPTADRSDIKESMERIQQLTQRMADEHNAALAACSQRQSRVTAAATVSATKAQVGTGGDTDVSSSSSDKDMRKLQKKLRVIDDLKARQAKGDKLEQTQLDKIGSEQLIKEEMRQLQELLSSLQVAR